MQDKGLTGDGKRKLPEFACKKSGKCNVTPKTRRRCQKCRYDLCIKAGMVPDAVMTDSQVKVRFRKMFTKRGEHRNDDGEINNPSEDYEINDAENHTVETYGQQEDEQPLTLYSQTFEQIPFGETQGNKQCEVDQNVPQEYNISSGRKEIIFPYGDRQQKETRVLTASRTQMRATSAPPPTASLVEEEEIFSSNFNYPPSNYCATESSKIPSNECDNNSVFQNVSKKHRILGSIGNEFISNIDQRTSDLIETCNFSNKEIKSEEPESLETEMEYHSYSPEGNHNILRYNEPDIEIFTKTEVEEGESEDTYPTVDQLRNEILDMDAESCEALKELGEKSNTGTNIQSNQNTSSNDGNVDLNETLHQMISDMEDDQKHTNMLQTPGTKMEDPFSDVESSIDFSKCIEQSIDHDVKVEESASPPHIFKSPTTLPLSITIKKWRKKKNSRTNNNRSVGFYVGENIQTQEDKDANNNRYHRMVKRIEEINTSYKIACCQVYFPNDLAYTLINFHVGCASAQNEDFLAVANSIVSKPESCSNS
jgi:flagellar hook-basal body complex protein FliE